MPDEWRRDGGKPGGLASGPAGSGGGSPANAYALPRAPLAQHLDPHGLLTAIEELGARVFLPPTAEEAARSDGWDGLAGAGRVREAVEEGLLFPLRHPEAFESTLRGTRAGWSDEHIRPTALLFYGPPGTGKTVAARLAAAAAALPLIACPLEGLISKW